MILLLLYMLLISCADPEAMAQISPPGGILEDQGIASRPRFTLAEINATIPAGRSTFTFPAPFNTRAHRITIPQDCTGNQDCVHYVGYSYWMRMSAHTSGNLIYTWLNLEQSRGGTGNTLFSFDKTTTVVTKIGNMFLPGDTSTIQGVPVQIANSETWYFSFSLPTKVYMTSGFQLWRYDILANTYEVPVTLLNKLYTNSNGTTTSFNCTNGSCPRRLFQFHSNYDDTIHAGSLLNSTNDAVLGCVVYLQTQNIYRFYPETNMDECSIDRSGQYTMTLVPFGTPGDTVGNKIYDNFTGTLVTTKTGPSGTLGHMDQGWRYALGIDNNGVNQPNQVSRCDYPSCFTSHNIYYDHPGSGAWEIESMRFPSHTNAVPTSVTPASSQYFCGSHASTFYTWANEITCALVVPGTPARRLVVAPVMTDPNASGGNWNNGDYGQEPKGSLDVTGRYFMWTTNLGGSRLDAFIVEVPGQRLTDQSAPVPPSGVTVQ